MYTFDLYGWYKYVYCSILYTAVVNACEVNELDTKNNDVISTR